MAAAQGRIKIRFQGEGLRIEKSGSVSPLQANRFVPARNSPFSNQYFSVEGDLLLELVVPVSPEERLSCSRPVLDLTAMRL